MFHIESFTAQADLMEDRIRLDAIDGSGASQSIFVTRRLADRFVALLLERVEAAAAQGAARDIDLTMKQQRVRMERQEHPPTDVELKEHSPRWLCVTMHLSGGSNGLDWTLTDDAGRTAGMPLGGDLARTVLDIFLLVYRRLEWPLDPFPEWLRELGKEAETAERTLN